MAKAKRNEMRAVQDNIPVKNIIRGVIETTD